MSTPPDRSAPAPSFPPPRPRGSPTLGIGAFLAGIVGIIAGAVLTFTAGRNLVVVAIFDGNTDAAFETFPADIQQATVTGTTLLLVGFTVLGVLGIAAIVLGIVATVKNRGRGWGITAIVLGAVGFLPVALALPIGMAVGSGG